MAGKKKEYKGIDISHWNKIVSFKTIKEEGIDFVIIKAGGNERGKLYKDVCFDTYYNEAVKAGLHVGCYFFAKPNYNEPADLSGALDAEQFISLIQGLKFDMPVYLDFEQGDKKKKDYNTKYVKCFLKQLEKCGYFVGLYASDISGFQEMLNKDDLKEFAWWVARYGKKPQYATESLQMWQYSSKGYISGCLSLVDLDISYVNYSTIIKKKGFNNYGV